MFSHINNNDTTFYAFKSNVKSFLGNLLKEPISCQPSEFLKKRGMTKQKLINILIKRGILERHEKIVDKDWEETNEVKYVVKYKVVKKQFERKLKRIFSKYFENNDKKEIEETTSCGASSGAFVGQLSFTKHKLTNESMKQNKKRKIFITKKQYEALQEALTTFNAGNYAYEAPISINKNDPSLIHKKKGGISMERL